MGRGIRVLAGTVAVGIGGLGAYKLYVDHDMKKYRRSETHTQDTALKHYMVQRGMGFIGRRFAVNLETDTADVESVQRGLLVSLLRRYQTTEYGKQHRLVDIGDRDVFLARHPLTQYKDYEAHVDRVCDGETHALVPEKSDLKLVGLTAGTTTGMPRRVPVTEDQKQAMFLYGAALAHDTLRRWVPSSESLQRSLRIMFPQQMRQAEGGIRIGSDWSNFEDAASKLQIYSTPVAAFGVSDRETLAYLHCLFALRDKELGSMECDFAHSVLDLFSLLESEETREALVTDIQMGTVAPHLDIPPHVRSSLEAGLRPDHARAREIRAAFEAHDARGGRVSSNGSPSTNGSSSSTGSSSSSSTGSLVGDLWPHLTCLVAVTTGSERLSQEILRARYFPAASEVPFYSPYYATAEGLLGVNIHPVDDGYPPLENAATAAENAYLLHPRAMFFEFIPLEGQPQTKFLEQLEVGGRYEVVVTTLSGFWRYRIGDIVQVVGKHRDQCPIVTVERQIGDVMDVAGERTPASIFADSVRHAIPDVALIEGAALVDPALLGTNRYHLLVEPRASMAETVGTWDSVATRLDEFLRQANDEYAAQRDTGAVAAPTVELLSPGALRRLRSARQEAGVGPTQGITPALIRHKRDLQCLRGNHSEA